MPLIEMTAMKKLKICLAQIEVVPGSPTINCRKMIEYIGKAKDAGADIITFPELCLSGYMIGDIWEREAFLKDCEACGKEIRTAAEGIVIIFGNVAVDWQKKNEDGRVRKYNALFVAEDGRFRPTSNGLWIDRCIIKTLLPEYREFEDNRHFYSYRKVIEERLLASPSSLTYAEAYKEAFAPIELTNGLKIGCMLCEDGWDTDYNVSPIEYLAPKSDLLINCSCSPFTYGKNDKRNRIFSRHTRDFKKPMVYVNCVGLQDNGKTIYTFDGRSCIYDREGNQVGIREPFLEFMEIVEVDISKSFGRPCTYKDNIGDLYLAVKYGISKFMERLWINKVVIGASGGIDSSLVAAIFSEILPKENILLVNMPSRYNSDTTKNIAKQLADNIGCRYQITPIEESVELTNRQIRMDLGHNVEFGVKDGEPGVYESDRGKLSGFMLENVQARDRSSRILAAYAALFGGVFTCNANKSEMTVGYTTLYGDLGGFLAPISDLWKTQVYEMARWFNANVKKVIPKGSIDIVPSAELSRHQNVDEGKGDPIRYEYHDLLFASWVERWNRATPENILEWQLAGALEEELGWTKPEKIMSMFSSPADFIADVERWWGCYQGLAVAKRIQAPPVLGLSRRICGGFDIRESQLVGITYTERYQKLKKEFLNK